MSLNTSKTILKVFGIISIIFGILGLLGGIASIFGGAAINLGTATGEVNMDATTAAGGAAVLGILGLIICFDSIIGLISGICSVRASKDSSKIMPAWIFALIGLVLSIISAISTFTFPSTTNGSTSNLIGTIIGVIIGVGIDALVFAAANNIKQSAGK
ncbi:MAG: hypothetical protein J6M39_00460 [Lachnospiraceae bacterium]|nr:hypothetical protein [Lachnospiraceae bacterium]